MQAICQMEQRGPHTDFSIDVSYQVGGQIKTEGFIGEKAQSRSEAFGSLGQKIRINGVPIRFIHEGAPNHLGFIIPLVLDESVVTGNGNVSKSFSYEVLEALLVVDWFTISMRLDRFNSIEHFADCQSATSPQSRDRQQVANLRYLRGFPYFLIHGPGSWPRSSRVRARRMEMISN